MKMSLFVCFYFLTMATPGEVGEVIFKGLSNSSLNSSISSYSQKKLHSEMVLKLRFERNPLLLGFTVSSVCNG